MYSFTSQNACKIYGGITDKDDVKAFAESLGRCNGDLFVAIDSSGGNTHQGFAYAVALRIWQKQSGHRAVARVTRAASVASVIACVCREVEMVGQKATMMMHECKAELNGRVDAADLARLSKMAEKNNVTMSEVYAAKSGAPASWWRDYFKTERELTAQECVDNHLATKIVDPDGSELMQMSHVPGVSKAEFDAFVKEETERQLVNLIRNGGIRRPG